MLLGVIVLFDDLRLLASIRSGRIGLEKLSPSLQHVDSSSGSMGAAVNSAIDTLVRIIAKPEVDRSVRQRWLERLWEAVEDDGMPYIEALGQYWGEVFVTTELASKS